MVCPPPPRLTPLSFFFFLPSSLGGLEERGRVASGSGRSSSSSEPESGESEKGNRPRASSMRDTPRDQTSDLIVYGAPWIRSGSLGQLNFIHEISQLTLIYVLVPTNVFAIELISSPETPKSQILISPLVFAKMLEGLISTDQLESVDGFCKLTSVDDTVHVVQVHQSLQYCLGNCTNNVDGHKATATVYLV